MPCLSLPGLVSLCTLTLLAYERYNVVCKPQAGFKLSMRRSLAGLLFVWVFCLFWAVAPLFGWSSYGPEGIQTSCSLGWEERSWSNYSYLILYTLLCFIFPVSVIIYCYSKILNSMNKVGFIIASVCVSHSGLKHSSVIHPNPFSDTLSCTPWELKQASKS